MASVHSDDKGILSCDSCMEVEGYIMDPKRLPCQHISCMKCLEDHLKDDGIIKCSKCNDVPEQQAIAELLSALDGYESFCDTCKKKGEPRKTAKVFCTECKRRYCAAHEETHDDLNEGHQMISIKAYRESAFSGGLRYCQHHKSEPITIGCDSCWITVCPLCLSSSGECRNEGGHKFVALIELERKFNGCMQPLNEKLEARFDYLSVIVNEATESLNEWDGDTEYSVGNLQNIRDEQLLQIRKKYADLEEEYRKSRDKGKQQLSQYKEKAETKLEGLYGSLKRLRNDLLRKHVVDVLNERDSFMTRIQSLINETFPETTMRRQKRFTTTRTEFRDIELKIEAVDDIHLGPDRSQTEILPTSIKLVKQVGIGDPRRVCHYQGYTYVATSNFDIDRIDSQGNITLSFISTLPGHPAGIIAHADRLYLLVEGHPHSVHVFDLTGKEIQSWQHDADSSRYTYRSLALVNNKLVVGDERKKQFVVFSLTGNALQSIECSRIDGYQLSLCQAGDDSIIVAHVKGSHEHNPVTSDEMSLCAVPFPNSQGTVKRGAQSTPTLLTDELYRVNLKTGAIEWSTKEITNPTCLTKLNEKFTLVSCWSERMRSRCFIIDTLTGSIVRELTIPSNHLLLDMCVEGDTVIIPRAHDNSVLYCRLKYL